MEVYNWKIFDKKGDYVNWTVDPYLSINFSDPNVLL